MDDDSQTMFSKQEAERLLLEDSDFFGPDPTNTTFRAAVLLLIGMGRRKDTFNLTRATRYPFTFVKKVRHNLIKAGVWKPNDKTTYCEWGDTPEGQTAFVLDALCGAGMITCEDKGVVCPTEQQGTT